MMLRKERNDSQSSPVNSGYPIGAVSTSTQPPYSYPPPSAPPSRQSAITQIYMQPAPQNYNHNQDRQSGGSYQENFIDRRYSFSQPAFPSSHDASMHSHSPTSNVQSAQSQRGNPNHVQNTLSYPPRRSITESQGYRPVLNQQLPPLPHVQQQSAHVVRIPSPVGLPEGVNSLRNDYDMESRVGRMS